MGQNDEDIDGRVLYAAVEPFDRYAGERWTRYAAWLGKPALQEVITLDGMLCPSLVSELKKEDWNHNVNANCLLELFHDFDYLKARTSDSSRRNLLAVVANPAPEQMTQIHPASFEFAGYDMVDMEMGVSSILNCGGYPEVFSVDELSSETGLLQNYARGCEIRDTLRERYPNDDHAQCRLWAIWRWVETES